MKNKGILLDLLQKWKVEYRQSWRPRTNAIAIFPVHVSKVLRLPRKSEARSFEVLHPSCKIILANLKIWCSKMQPRWGNQRSDLRTALMNMSLVLRLPHERHLARSSAYVPSLPSFLKLLQNPHVLLTFSRVQNPFHKWHEHVVALAFSLRNVLRATAPCTFSTSQLPKALWTWGVWTFWLGNVLFATTPCTCSSPQLQKVLQTWGVLYILTWKCASRRNAVHFFIISASKSAPRMLCFVHFDLEMRFAPQRRTLFIISTSKSAPRMLCFVHFDFEICLRPQRRAFFQRRNSQECSKHEVFLAFWLRNSLRATTACNFSFLIRPDGSAPAALASLLVDPPAPQNIGKTEFRDFSTFSCTCIFFLLTFSSLIFFLLLFSAPLLFHLAFPSVHIVGSLTSDFLRSYCVFCALLQLLKLLEEVWFP